ncbi:MAG: glutathione S-transferase family protein [Acetobacteraceae bacterium]|nr:glutathione S-transferase family protein [Acetobacteraceae bacterium]
MSIRLFYAPGACSLAPHVVLEWIGQPYEAVRVQYGSQELLELNPAGAVPVLDTGEGWTLTQAGAILHYLARRFPDAGLGVDGSLQQEAEFDRWSSFFTGDLHPAFFPIFLASRYTQSKDPAAHEEVRQAAYDMVRKRLNLLDTHLAGREQIVGEHRTVLDAYALPMMRWAAAKLPEGLVKHPNVKAHLDRIAGDPSVRKVIADEEGD